GGAKRRMRGTSVEVLPESREALRNYPALRDDTLVDKPGVVLRAVRSGCIENRRIAALNVLIDQRGLEQPVERIHGRFRVRIFPVADSIEDGERLPQFSAVIVLVGSRDEPSLRIDVQNP